MDIGIAPTQDALETYNKLKQEKNLRYIIFYAKDNQIQVEKTGDRESTYDQFVKDLTPNEPRYCVFDYHFEFDDGRKSEKLVYIFWCPDTAKIQQKMISATCNQSFKAKISGISYFLQANDFDDLTESNVTHLFTKA
ncbi:hypothetical protein PPERSA_03343 [Pseudocohnilembus persalinus]|uniref:ADF-H domain-containing protein n=1 Tax=Pseudocohnilembus persalinus TaxID=266149 RepID=A0A0V0R1U7_PSEPJ|nr:hypothetical protein PPERSA_03343 [Pseudocohnilembus persalinus]|eukprot:KRX08349.1 hypothetical protein PPERSA_03343 [Pseudocohnilembus persalinus]